MEKCVTELNKYNVMLPFSVFTFTTRFIELGPDQHDEIKNQIIDTQVK